MNEPKTFVLSHHIYRVVYTTDTKEKAVRAKKVMYGSNLFEHNPTAIKLLSNGRWAVGIRKKY